MSAAPRVSVIVPAYNAAAYVGACLGSLAAQSAADWECIVVDDGSTDATAARVRSHADPRVRLLAQANAGAAAARNRGLACARGEHVLFLDADDALHPDALRRLCAALDASGAAVAAYGTAWAIFADGRDYPQAPLARRRFPSGDVLERLIRENFLLVGMVLLRARAARRLGGFDARLRMGEDWDFWCRLAALGEFRFVGAAPEVSYVRVRPGSASREVTDGFGRRGESLEAVLTNGALAARFTPRAWRRLARQALASQLWEAGRVCFTARRYAQARRLMLRSLGAAASPRRLALFALAQASQLVGRPLTARLRFVDEEQPG